MNAIGLVISRKENEKRRALIPEDIDMIAHPGQLYFETGYGEVLGLTDDDYRAKGANVVSREEALRKEVVCDPKIGDAEYLGELEGQIVFGWLHAVQNKEIADTLTGQRLTGVAWEDMYADGRHTFYRNNEIAGEAAIMHAFECHGEFPYGKRVAVLGRGNVAMGAIKALHYLGAHVTTYDRRTEKLFHENIGEYDAIVNAILWDTTRQDHIIYREDLKRMKRNALIIDISCDRNGGIETSVPTTIENPTYCIDTIRHYVVDHTPSLFYKTASEEISHAVAPMFNSLIDGTFCTDPVLGKAVCVLRGEIKDKRITEFQQRHGDSK